MLFSGFLLALVILFLFVYFRNLDWALMKDMEIDIRLYLAAIAVLTGIRFVYPIVWIQMLKDFRLQLHDPINLFFVYAKSWMGRYIPGKIFSVSGKIFFASKQGYDKKVLTMVSFLETIIQIVTGILSGLLIVGLSSKSGIDFRLTRFALIGGIGMLVFVLPPVFNRISCFGYKLLRKKSLDQQYEFRFLTLIRTMIAFFATSLFIGLGVSLICLSVDTLYEIWSNLLYMTGAMNLAGSIGIVMLFAPIGIGVREGILTLLLAPFFSKEELLLVLVLIRLASLLSDLLFFIISWLLVRLKKLLETDSV